MKEKKIQGKILDKAITVIVANDRQPVKIARGLLIRQLSITVMRTNPITINTATMPLNIIVSFACKR